MSIGKNIKHSIRMMMSYVAPRLLASIYYRNVSSKSMNWNDPKDLNEIINWLKFNSDTSLWSLLADKYRVREYVHEKGLDDILVKLYGVWDDANDIDFDLLPQKFVLKTNHGSGTNIIVKDKSKLDILTVRKTLNDWLKLRFGQETVEFHYLKIKPCIIAEELLEEKTNSYSKTLVDYKVWCFEGKPHYIFTCYGRTSESIFVSTFDIDWNYCPEGSIFNSFCKNGGGIVPKPNCLDEMLKIASVLSEGQPQARIDFYVVDGKLYFGEITFSSQGGYMNYFTHDFLLKMGSFINRDRFKK